MITFKVVLDRPKKDGSVQVRIRTIFERKATYIPTGIFIQSKDFNPKATTGSMNWIRNTNPNAVQFNQFLSKRIAELLATAQEGIHSGRFSPDQLKKSKSNGVGILEFIQTYIEMEGSANSRRWSEKYQNIRSKLSKYLNGQDVALKNVDFQFVKGFRNYMAGIGNKPTTIQRSLSFVRTVIHYAVKVGHLKYEEDPFHHIPLPAPKVHKDRLTEDELVGLITYVGTDRSVILATRVFALQYYLAGMRIGDLLQLKQKNIDGVRLVYVMDKTDHHTPLIIPAPARLILEWFGLDQPPERFLPDSYILPYLDAANGLDKDAIHRKVESATAVINRNLKIAAAAVGIQKKVTSHMARHTFADHARRKSGDLYAISKALGHSALKITENYLARFDQDPVDNLMTEMFG
jgi:integrase/recombinase XerD